MKRPEIVTATPAQIDELLARAKPSFPPEQYELLAQVLATFVYVMQSLHNAKSSIKRLRQMLFGAPTESARNLLKGNGELAWVKRTPLSDLFSRRDHPIPGLHRGALLYGLFIRANKSSADTFRRLKFA